MKLVRVALFGMVGGAAALVACSSDQEAPEDPLLPDTGVPETGSPDVPLLDGGACEPTCSPDGKSIVCDGGTLEVCAEDKTCYAGKCLTPCELAEAKNESVGCEYYLPTPDAFVLALRSCFAAFVVNPNPEPVELSVDLGGAAFDVSKFAYLIGGSGKDITYTPLADSKLPAGKGAVLFLTEGPEGEEGLAPCPEGTEVATYADTFVRGAGRGTAFHLQASAPIVAYDMHPYGGGGAIFASASLLLPTSTWGKNYVAIDPAESNGAGAPWIALVAKEDNTEVSIVPTSDIPASGPGMNAIPKGTVGKIKLNRGEVVQLEQEASLLGSPIVSDKPVGLWGGHTLLFIPADTMYGDAAHQQIPPVFALGHEYVAVAHRDRFDTKPETNPWRIVAAVDGTQLTYIPSAPPGAPTTLNSGQAADFTSTAPFVVRSQDDKHPFYMAGYMSGCMMYDPLEEDCRGDPEFVNVVPPAQYTTNYTFLTDPTYPETHLVVVRTKGESGFADVVLDCAGPLTGWKALGDKHEYTRVDLVRHDFQPQGTCDNGVHSITSTLPFGITVWGWGTAATRSGEVPVYTEAVSYAYPAGMYVKPITDIVVPAIPK